MTRWFWCKHTEILVDLFVWESRKRFGVDRKKFCEVQRKFQGHSDGSTMFGSSYVCHNLIVNSSLASTWRTAACLTFTLSPSQMNTVLVRIHTTRSQEVHMALRLANLSFGNWKRVGGYIREGTWNLSFYRYVNPHVNVEVRKGVNQSKRGELFLRLKVSLERALWI